MGERVEGSGFVATARCPLPKNAALLGMFHGDKRRAGEWAARFVLATEINIGARTARVSVEWRYNPADPYRVPTPGGTANSAVGVLAAVLGCVYRGRNWTEPLPEPFTVCVRSVAPAAGGAR